MTITSLSRISQRPPQPRPGIVTRAVTVRRDRRIVLHSITATFPRGNVIGLVGPNGSGKTTLLRTLLGAMESSGKITIDGTDLRKIPRRMLPTLLSYVPQHPLFPGGYTTHDFVHLASASRDATERAIDSLELNSLRDRRIDTLSGGQRQRVAIAQALAQESSAFLIDEPTASLDVGHAQRLLTQLRTLATEHDRVVIVALHDLTLAARFVDSVIVLREGSCLAQGKPVDVFDSELINDVFDAQTTIVMHDNAPVIIPRVPSVLSH